MKSNIKITGIRRQPTADLRCCASCEWVFSAKVTGSWDCPKCEFATYGAYSVFGNKSYYYHKSQEPWLNQKLEAARSKLMAEVSTYNAMRLSLLPKSTPLLFRMENLNVLERKS